MVDGKWKTLDGQWHNFKELDQADNAFKQNSLKTSKHWAEVRGAKAANAWKWTGRICFGITAGVSIYNIADAYTYDDSNKNEVYLKSGLDITMDLVAFIPGFGWALSDSKTKKGSLIYYRNDSVSVEQKVEFFNAFCVKYLPHFKAEGKSPRVLHIVISAETLYHFDLISLIKYVKYNTDVPACRAGRRGWYFKEHYGDIKRIIVIIRGLLKTKY